eukprot:1161225-Pelagomonas_calceolata.AAC.10
MARRDVDVQPARSCICRQRQLMLFQNGKACCVHTACTLMHLLPAHACAHGHALAVRFLPVRLLPALLLLVHAYALAARVLLVDVMTVLFMPVPFLPAHAYALATCIRTW